MSLDDRHNQTVATIARKIAAFHQNKQKFRIYHGGTNSTRALNFERDRIIDTSSLTRVLRVDTGRRVALVEPNVSMEALAEATLQHDLIPQVVMELPAITVGGGYSGTSGESSSFKYGFFENTISWIEIVLADGTVTTASKGGEREDLLESAAGSFGTLGVVTCLEVQLVPSKKYVKLEVVQHDSVSDTLKAIESATSSSINTSTDTLNTSTKDCADENPSSDIDFVDGIVFSQKCGVAMLGRLSDAEPDESQPLVRFSRARDQWFYRYIEKRLRQVRSLESSGPHSTSSASQSTPSTKASNLSSSSPSPASSWTITVPIIDYFFRYDRGAFWGGKWAFRYFLTPFNRITRFLLDPLMHTSVMFHALHESGLANENVIQDIAFPLSTAGEFISFVDRAFGYYPLWLCPLRSGHPIPLRPRTGSESGDRALREELLVNVGIWGPGSRDEITFVTTNRDIEKRTRQLYGAKCLYARAYYTEDEFWQIYDRKWYDAARARYGATDLPTVYDKMKFDFEGAERRARRREQRWLPRLRDIWPLAGMYGAVKAVLGLYSSRSKEYVFAKKK